MPARRWKGAGRGRCEKRERKVGVEICGRNEECVGREGLGGGGGGGGKKGVKGRKKGCNRGLGWREAETKRVGRGWEEGGGWGGRDRERRGNDKERGKGKMLAMKAEKYAADLSTNLA